MDQALMRMRLEREYTFEAAHYLPRVPADHRCSRVHGHSYAVTIAIEGVVDPDLGWILDFATLDTYVLPLIGQLDHRLLNDIAGLANPTSELLAVWIWEHLVVVLASLVEIIGRTCSRAQPAL